MYGSYMICPHTNRYKVMYVFYTYIKSHTFADIRLAYRIPVRIELKLLVEQVAVGGRGGSQVENNMGNAFGKRITAWSAKRVTPRLFAFQTLDILRQSEALRL